MPALFPVRLATIAAHPLIKTSNMATSWSSRSLKAVLFDLYGTLVDVSIDTEPPSLWHQLAVELAPAGIHVSPEELCGRYHEQVDSDRREYGEPFVLNGTFFEDLLGTGAHVPQELVTGFGRRFRQLTTRHIRLRDYALPLLHTLRRSGCLIGLVSNTDATLTAHDLEELRVADEFDTIVLSSQVGVKKPDPAIFRIALERLEVSASETIHIGDDYCADFMGAAGAQLRPILLCFESRQRSSQCVPARLEDILQALQQQGLQAIAA